MIIENAFVLPASREEVAKLLVDIHRVGPCVPGVTDIRQVDERTYAAQLSVSVGPISSLFDGQVTVDDSEAPETLRATGEGKDSRSGSAASITFSAQLAEVGAHETRVTTTSDVTIRGRLGQFGTGVIKSTADEMIKEFSQCLTASLRGEEATSRAAAGKALTGRRLALTTLRGLLARLGSFLKRLLNRIRNR